MLHAMNLEQWSQVAGIGAIPIGIIVWLVDRKQVITFCKKWSKIIVVAFAGVILFAVWQRGYFNWLFHPVTWPVWALIILGFFSLAIPVGTVLIIAYFERQPSRPTENDPFSYLTDIIFGIEWVWGYIGTQLNVHELSAFCPNQSCKCRLEPEFTKLLWG